MKKLAFVLLALLTFNVSAQRGAGTSEDRKQRKENFEQYSPQEIAQLQTKKMTLHLDLTEAQQQKVNALLLQQAEEKANQREARLKMREDKKEGNSTKEERLRRKNERLDKMIAFKKEMKAILNAEQFEKWEAKMTKKKGRKAKMKKENRG